MKLIDDIKRRIWANKTVKVNLITRVVNSWPEYAITYYTDQKQLEAIILDRRNAEKAFLPPVWDGLKYAGRVISIMWMSEKIAAENHIEPYQFEPVYFPALKSLFYFGLDGKICINLHYLKSLSGEETLKEIFCIPNHLKLAHSATYKTTPSVLDCKNLDELSAYYAMQLINKKNKDIDDIISTKQYEKLYDKLSLASYYAHPVMQEDTKNMKRAIDRLDNMEVYVHGISEQWEKVRKQWETRLANRDKLVQSSFTTVLNKPEKIFLYLCYADFLTLEQKKEISFPQFIKKFCSNQETDCKQL